MFLYINAIDPKAPIEVRLWESGAWTVYLLDRPRKGGPLLAIDGLLKSKHKTISNIRALFVFMGKGSFTATRSIATIANALALSTSLSVFALNKPPTEDPNVIITTTQPGKYVLPVYSEPARIGPPLVVRG